jgi:hypothetical protein
MYQQSNNLQRDSDLNKNCNRAIKTTMIGAISRFEKAFGYLWGQGKEQLTENEQKFLALWLQTRNEVLDCGNEQSRIIDKEFKKHIVKPNYQYKFKVVNRRDVNGNV